MTTAGERASLDAWCGALSLLVPVLLYVWTAAPAPVWLDTAEFLAVGFSLGGAHPPGHPLYLPLVKMACLVPFGPMAFRAALVSAIPAALSCLLLFGVVRQLCPRLDPTAPRWVGPVFGLVAAVLLAGSPALWLQATRVEVYALQLCLVAAVVLALAKASRDGRGERDGRYLVLALFLWSISLANHHFMSLMLVPALIVFFTEDALGHWQRTVRILATGGIVALGVGLLPYAHLVLRAGRVGPAVSLGEAPDGPSFFWVVTARAFQRAVTQPPAGAFEDRLLETSFMLFRGLGVGVVFVALGGLYFLSRRIPGMGLFLVVGALLTWAARGWMGFDPQNPDLHGYLLPAIAVLALGAAVAGPLMLALLPTKRTVRVGAMTVWAVLLVASAASLVARRWADGDLSRTWTAETVAWEQIASLPPRSVAVTELFSTGFNLWAAQVIEGLRPDVAHFHLTFVGFPSYVQQVHRRYPDLRGLLRTALAQGGLAEEELAALAQRRPLFVEPMLQTTLEAAAFLQPRGLLWEATGEPLTVRDLKLSFPEHIRRWDRLLALLGEAAREEQTRRVLLWRLYLDALLMARRGACPEAEQVVERALVVAPGTPELQVFRAALAEHEGPLDVTPFLPQGAAPAAQLPPEGSAGSRRIEVLSF